MNDKEVRRVNSASRIDVNRLDKVYSVQNRLDNDILLEGLPIQDQLYIIGLTGTDSSSSSESINEDNNQIPKTGNKDGIWLPLVNVSRKSLKFKKRIKKLRPTATVTLSLEDISYIRPSWTISKGIKRNSNQKTNKKIKKDKQDTANETLDELGNQRSGLIKVLHDNKRSIKQYTKLFVLMLLLFALIIFGYFSSIHRRNHKQSLRSVKVKPKSRLLSFYHPEDNEKILGQIRFGLGLPYHLKFTDCSCEQYDQIAERFKANLTSKKSQAGLKLGSDCISCFDWAYRANLRIYGRPNEQDTKYSCYDIKWQSYDSFKTPIIDCFPLSEEEVWLGLGDIQKPSLPLGELLFNETKLSAVTDFEFKRNITQPKEPLAFKFGSQVEFVLLSSTGMLIYNLRSTSNPYVSLRYDLITKNKMFCLSMKNSYEHESSEKRFKNFDIDEDYDDDEMQNNNSSNVDNIDIVEYEVCNGRGTEFWSSYLLNKHTRKLINEAQRMKWNVPNKQEEAKASELSLSDTNNDAISNQEMISKKLRIDQQPGTYISRLVESTTKPQQAPTNKFSHNMNSLSIVDRPIFITSHDYMPSLDSISLRKFVDSIIKIGSKAGCILSVDYRWETYMGSMIVDWTRLPPDLFEILHNKGFKVIFTVKPYIDAGIKIETIEELIEYGRIFSINPRNGLPISQHFNMTSNRKQKLILRRKSFFEQEIVSRTKATGQQVDFRDDNNGAVESTFIDIIRNKIEDIEKEATRMIPYFCKCGETDEQLCLLTDLTQTDNRNWFIEKILESSLKIIKADGIRLAGMHPNSLSWNSYYAKAMDKVARSLLYEKDFFTLPVYSASFGLIQIAPRPFTWKGLRSTLSSVIHLSMTGFPLVNSGSVGGDIKYFDNKTTHQQLSQSRLKNVFDMINEQNLENRNDKELFIRWLQVAMFMPILQFNNIQPIEEYKLQDLVQSLLKTRRLYVTQEIKRCISYSPLIHANYSSRFYAYASTLSNNINEFKKPLIKPVFHKVDGKDKLTQEEFIVGENILVAPIMKPNIRQRDIFLPIGMWNDELTQQTIRGGKWLRNHQVDLNEVAWFTRIIT